MMRSTLTPPVRSGHSAVVEMTLIAGGSSHRVAQMGGDFIILEESMQMPPCEGELTLEVDGEIERWSILLPNGVAKDCVRTPIKRTDFADF